MTEGYYNLRVTDIIDRGLNYADQMCTLRTQKDPGYRYMENEYRMLLNILDALDGYDVATTLFTDSEIRYLFELSTDILKNDMKGIIHYTFTGTADYIDVADGLIIYRKSIRSGMYVIDKSIDGGVTWDLALFSCLPDEDTYIIDIDDGIAGWRQVVRDGYFCIDRELGGLGFDGVEGVDWENVFNMI